MVANDRWTLVPWNIFLNYIELDSFHETCLGVFIIKFTFTSMNIGFPAPAWKLPFFISLIVII